MKKYNVEVKKEFPDRYTGLIHKAGEKLVMTDARIREVKRSGDYVKVLDEIKPKAPQKPEPVEKKEEKK